MDRKWMITFGLTRTAKLVRWVVMHIVSPFCWALPDVYTPSDDQFLHCWHAYMLWTPQESWVCVAIYFLTGSQKTQVSFEKFEFCNQWKAHTFPSCNKTYQWCWCKRDGNRFLHYTVPKVYTWINQRRQKKAVYKLFIPVVSMKNVCVW